MLTLKQYAPLPLSLCFGLCLLVSFNVSANSAPEAIRFEERKAEGWFFYNEKYEEEPEPEDAPPPPLPTTTTTAPPEPTPAEAKSEPAPPAPLSAKWMRENLPKYMDAAWNDPSPENVQAFFMLQRFAMDRSGEFADVAREVTMGNVMLDESTRRPFSSFASQDLDRQAGQRRRRLLQDIAQKAGLFVFYESDCGLCKTMAPILSLLNSDFTMTPISLDGKDLPGDPFPNMRPDQGHAEQLGVETLPAIYLVTPEGEFMPLAHGATSLTDLRERIVLGATQLGVISEDAYNSTRSVNNLHLDLSPGSIQPNAGAMNPTGFIDPAALLQQLEAIPQQRNQERR